MKENISRYKKYLFYLMALHSAGVGIGLITQPSVVFNFLGYETIQENFFPAQGGVFHLLMAFCYYLCAIRLESFGILIFFSFVVKMTAALFLFLYFIFVSSLTVTLLSALSDLIMGLVIYFLFGYSYFLSLFRYKNE